MTNDRRAKLDAARERQGRRFTNAQIGHRCLDCGCTFPNLVRAFQHECEPAEQRKTEAKAADDAARLVMRRILLLLVIAIIGAWVMTKLLIWMGWI